MEHIEAVPDFHIKREEFLKNLNITPAEVIKVMNTPQRTPEWLKWREKRMTASNYGAACGHNPYSGSRQLLMQLLWDTFRGNSATEWGTKNESVAAAVYEKFLTNSVKTQSLHHRQYKSASVFYPGLIICQHQPWLAVSPDGLPVFTTHDGQQIRFLLEIKCPFSKVLYEHIPHYYFDQIQGIMGILQLPFCDFFVWTPQKSQIRRYAFDRDYWLNVLYPKLYLFYMNEYMPRLIMKEHQLLRHKELEPTLNIDDGGDGDDGDNNNQQQGQDSPPVKRRRVEFDFMWKK